MPQYRVIYKTLPVERQDQLHLRTDEEEERSQKTKEGDALRKQEFALGRKRQDEEKERHRRPGAERTEDSPDRDLRRERYLQNEPWQCLRDVLSERTAAPSSESDRSDQLPDKQRKFGSLPVESCREKSPSPSQERSGEVQRQERSLGGELDQRTMKPDVDRAEFMTARILNASLTEREISNTANIEQYIQNKPAQVLRDASKSSSPQYREREPWHTLADVLSQPLSRHYSEVDPKRQSPDKDHERASQQIEPQKAPRDNFDEPRRLVQEPRKPDSNTREIHSAKHREQNFHAPFEGCQSIKPWQAILNLPAKTEERLIDSREQRTTADQSRHDVSHHSARQVDVSAPSQKEQHEKTQHENQFDCSAPIEIVRAAVKIGPLERETIANLQARYDHPGPHQVDVPAWETPRPSGELPCYSPENIVLEKDSLSNERPEHQQQIECLQSLDLKMESSREHEHATQILRTNSEHTVYEDIDMQRPLVREAYHRPESHKMLEHKEISRQIEDELRPEIEVRSADDHRDEAVEHLAPVCERQFICAVPVDVAKAVIEIADLEPKCLAFLHAQYGYAEPYVFSEATDHDSQISAQSFRLAAQNEIDAKSLERLDRAQGQIELLQSIDRELHNSPRYYEYATLTLNADANTAVYHVSDVREASWAKGDYPQALQQVLDQRADKTENHVHDRREEEQCQSSRLPRARPRTLIATIQRDLNRYENEVDRLDDEEPAPETFWLVECTARTVYCEMFLARTVEEFFGFSPGTPATQEAIDCIVDLDQRYKLWLARRERSSRQLQDKRYELCQHYLGPTDDYDYDDFDR